MPRLPRRRASISAYLLIFIALAVVPVVIGTFVLTGKIAEIEQTSRVQTQQLAEKEFNNALTRLEVDLREDADRLARWDETRMLLSDSTYYHYWKQSRVPEVGKLPSSVDAVDLYDRSGKPLVPDHQLPAHPPADRTQVYLMHRNSSVDMLYFHAIHAGGERPEVIGYLGVRLNVDGEIRGRHNLSYSSFDGIEWNLPDGELVALAAALRRVRLDVPEVAEILALSQLVQRAFNSYTFYSILLLALLYALLTTGLGRPLHRLATAINALREGRIETLPEAAEGPLGITEISTLRQAINDYRNKFHSASQTLMEKNEELLQLTYRDTLTGVYNRRAFENHLTQALESAIQENKQHALCYLDLDQFKIVNDTCGHIAGDQLLRQVAHQLQGQIREADLLARLGGDEFGVLLEDCPTEKAVQIADALRQTIKDFRFAWLDKTFELGVSIGLVPITAISGSITAVMSAADSACYVAKDQGRNRVHVYESDDEALSRRHGEMQWVSRISKALVENRLLLYGQMIRPIDPASGLPVIVEVLLRLRDEDGRLVPPGAFIPAAERYNLMSTLDRWVIENSLTCLQSQEDAAGSNGFLCSINLSGQSLSDSGILDFVIDQLDRHRVAPQRLCFEITETAAIANFSQATRFISVLKARGCNFSLDDFGSGLSSFAYLKNLKVDYLKIDGHFVRDMATDPIDAAMVEAIHQIGHVMGIRTVAEFVEDDAVLERLGRLGVDYAQGYGIAQPQPLQQELACHAPAGDNTTNVNTRSASGPAG